MSENSSLDIGTYELLRSRLMQSAEDLRKRLDILNVERKEVFGALDFKLLSTTRVTTDNNCIPRDIHSFGTKLLMGYNVHIGLKAEVGVEDVFSQFKFENHQFQKEPLAFLNDEKFLYDFKELYTYYRGTVFSKFSQIGPFVYMVFQVGKTVQDFKTFKWQVSGTEWLYKGNRSDHEFKFPLQFDFEWKRATRDFQRTGSHPHISILDKVFVETIRGDLTIKVEDNTDTGEGIYSEPVSDRDQKLDDAEIYFADLGNVILLKIRPFNENEFRHFIFNHKLKTAIRAEGIKDSCVLLPDQHGIIFSKGYYLQNGDYKLLDHEETDLLFERRLVSPNGEDYLYVFYNQVSGTYVLLPYNLIEQKVENLISCHGFCFYENGETLYFNAQAEPAKHHVVQIWQTPYIAIDFEIKAAKDSYLYKIGNKDIVRCMADCSSLLQLIQRRDEQYANLYVDLIKWSADILDAYFWIKDERLQNLALPLQSIREASVATVDEFEKVLRIRKQTLQAQQAAAKAADTFQSDIRKRSFDRIEDFVAMLTEGRRLSGDIAALREMRYIDLTLVEKLDTEVKSGMDQLSNRLITFMAEPQALAPYRERIKEQHEVPNTLKKVAEVKTFEETLLQTGADLELLIQIISNLKIDDATLTTSIIEDISLLFSELNKIKAIAKQVRMAFLESESASEFHAQVKLLEQSIINYLDLSTEPEKCDAYLARLMVQIEELEGRFAEFPDFLKALAEKRDQVYEAFESRKLQLKEARARRAGGIYDAAQRILTSIQRKAEQFKELAEIHAYFASDILVAKVRDSIAELLKLNETVKADELVGKLKYLQEEVQRNLRDRQEIYSDGGQTIQFGAFKFLVNTQTIELTMIQRNEEMFYHLSGTGFMELITSPQAKQFQAYWNQSLPSENELVYRSEFLAWTLFQEITSGRASDWDSKQDSSVEAILPFVQKHMAARYSEGYMKGVHDHDAALLLHQLLLIHQSAELLIYPGKLRAFAMLFWFDFLSEDLRLKMEHRLRSLVAIHLVFPLGVDLHDIQAQLDSYWLDFSQYFPEAKEISLVEIIAYLYAELAQSKDWVLSHEALSVSESFNVALHERKAAQSFFESLEAYHDDRIGKYRLAVLWLNAYCTQAKRLFDEDLIAEVALSLIHPSNTRRVVHVQMHQALNGLLGEHGLIAQGQVHLDFIAFTKKMQAFQSKTLPEYHAFQEWKSKDIAHYRKELKLDSFKPKVMSSFVRNQLLDEVYLPLIGSNLAKQIGVTGVQKRTDNSGLLLLISPPGYGKTTLMEYVAAKLGLVFMKINGPSIGNRVGSLDPAEAPNATAREELEKLGLAFEMGDNVMIYLDDIQHLNPEFLQKFISLCDAQRKIEGVYKGATRTYDFRGKKVSVVMAGNPYTESGDKFQIPDMLANRADTFNLGDAVGAHEDAFKLSYIENAAASQPVLARLAKDSIQDIRSLCHWIEEGRNGLLELQSPLASDDRRDIESILEKMIWLRGHLMKVNAAYIDSATQSDAYRTEPAFKLQGSYRNMSKLTEKLVPAMNDDELKALLENHYRNESQTLTKDAEANLLKWRELCGFMSDSDRQRWEDIKGAFRKNKKFAGMAPEDTMGQLMLRIGELGEGLEGIEKALNRNYDAE